MGQISSINLKKSNAIQTKHNDRELPPSYLIGKDYEINYNAEQAQKLRDDIINSANKAYTERTGQRPQYKQENILWSAVVNLKPNSTMQDLEKLADHFKEKYGWQCYQIAIHRDEGHIDENGEKIINHHAHLEFVMLDKKGINRFKKRDFGRAQMREIQTETAQILQMERGIDKRISKTKRIEPRKYAQLKEQEKEKLKSLKKQNSLLNAQIQTLSGKKQKNDLEPIQENKSLKNLLKCSNLSSAIQEIILTAAKSDKTSEHKYALDKLTELQFKELKAQNIEKLKRKLFLELAEKARKIGIGRYDKSFFDEINRIKRDLKDETKILNFNDENQLKRVLITCFKKYKRHLKVKKNRE